MRYTNLTSANAEKTKKQLEAEINYYAKKLEEVKEEADKVVSLKDEIRKHEKLVELSNKKIEGANGEHEVMLKQIQDKKKVLDSLNAEIVKTQSEVEKEKDKATKFFGAVSEEKDSHASAIADFKNRAELIKEDVAQAKIQLSDLAKQIKEKEKELNGQNVLIGDNTNSIKDLQSEKLDISGQVETLKAEIAPLKKGISDLISERSEIRKNVSDLRAEIVKLNEDADKTEKKLNSFKSEYDEKKGDLSIMGNSLEEKEKQLKEFKIALEKVHGKPIKINL